jgi:hypothetical protein
MIRPPAAPLPARLMVALAVAALAVALGTLILAILDAAEGLP